MNEEASGALFLFGLAGLCLVSYGIEQAIGHGAGYITAGVLCLAFFVWVARS